MQIPLSAAAVTEAEVKAIYLYNFASFVSWPASEPGIGQPFCICALGENQVSRLLPKIIEGEKIQGHPMEFRSITDGAETEHCQILFFASQDQQLNAKVLHRVQRRPILTVGEQKGFATQGGHIELGLNGSRVRLTINRPRVEQSGLRISAKLYRLARVLDKSGPEAP